MKEVPAPQTRAEKKRAQIRAAAKHLFLQHGFQATSTDAIAAAAATSKETLYHHYPKKEDLFIDVLRSLTIERLFWVELMERATEPQSPQELRLLLQTTAQGLLEMMMDPEYLALLRLLMTESPRFPELGALFRQTIPAQGFAYFLALLGAGKRNGVVQAHIDPPTVARMFLGTLLTYTHLDGLIQPMQAPQIPDPGAIETLVDHMMGLISVQPRE